jgi:NADH-quinone oxidoreductase subunit G
LSMPIEQVENIKAALLIGSYLRHEQPLLNQRLRKATQGRGKVMAINPVDFDFNYRLSAKAIVSMPEMVNSVARLAVALIGDEALSVEEKALVVGTSADETAQKMAALLRVDGHKVIFLGQIAQSHPAFARLMQLAALVAKLSGATLAWLPEAGNSLGASLVGAEPAGVGMNAAQMLAQGMKNWILWGVEPQDALLAQAQQLSGRVISVSAFDTPALRDVSDWMLPIGAFAEVAGSYVNANATWQFSPVALSLQGDAKPGWKVLRVLGNLMNVAGFEFTSLDQVTVEAQAKAKTAQAITMTGVAAASTPAMSQQGLARVAVMPMYATDMLVRQSLPLQAHEHAGMPMLRIHPQDAAAFVGQTDISVATATGSVRVPFVVDAKVALGCVVAPMVWLFALPADYLTLTA